MSLTFDWLGKQAELNPDKTALVDAATGREFTYRQFDDRGPGQIADDIEVSDVRLVVFV